MFWVKVMVLCHLGGDQHISWNTYAKASILHGDTKGARSLQQHKTKQCQLMTTSALCRSRPVTLVQQLGTACKDSHQAAGDSYHVAPAGLLA